MTNEEVRESVKLFTELEQWQGFLELAARSKDVFAEFFAPATREIAEQLAENLPSGWVCERGTASIDDNIRCYHGEYGANSIGIWFGWKYQLILRLPNQGLYDVDGLFAAVDSAKYAPLRNAMMRCDPRPDRCCLLIERRNFHFGTEFDGEFPEGELAWYAYYHKKEFVTQAVNKLQRFLGNEEVVRMIEELNHTFRNKP